MKDELPQKRLRGSLVTTQIWVVLWGAFHSTKISVWNFGNPTSSMEQYIPVAQTRPKAPRVLLLGWFWQQIGNVSWQRRVQIKQLAWPMAQRQIGHRKSSLVLTVLFPVVKWRSCFVAKISLITKRAVPCVGSVQTECTVPLSSWGFQNFKPKFLLNGKRPKALPRSG